MKVLHVIDNLNAGGAQTMFRFFLKNGGSLNVDTYGYSLKKSNFQFENFISEKTSQNISITRFYRLKKLIRSENFDIIHLHLNNSVLHGFVLQKFLNPKIKWVIHEHGEVFRNDIIGVILNWIYGAFKRANFIAVSKAVEEKLSEKGMPKSQIQVIPNVAFVEPTKLLPKENQPIFNVGFVGRVTERKNWKGFLEVAQRLKANKGFLFCVYGSGPDLDKMKSFVKKLELNDSVKFCGWKESQDEIYPNLNSLLLLSKWEGFSLVQLEALSYGVPVISFNNKGMNELAESGNGLFLCEADDLEAVVNTLSKLQSNSEFFAENQLAAPQLVKDKTSEKYMESLNTFYNSLLKQ